MKRTLGYQQEASNQIINYLLDKPSFKLQSPTGSGKTMIIGQTIEKIVTSQAFLNVKKTFIFIAPSTGALDFQGYEKISNYLHQGWLKGFRTEYIGTKGKTKKGQYLTNIDFFEENTIYFIGWSLFGKNANLSKIDSEKNDIQRVLQNTKQQKNQIFLIIDEAHREVMTKSDNKESILNNMDPYKLIEVSATLDNPDYQVSLLQVRDEKAIKKNVVVDMGIPEFGDDDVDRPGEISSLIQMALKKQKGIKEAYIKRNIDGNPLILIQIPDNKNNKILKIGKKIESYYLEEVEKILQERNFKRGINYAVWLSNDKTNSKEDIITMNSGIEILIFKQAIATGWDIPRANMLVRLREPKEPKFDIQTLGRILRNPRFRYYDNSLIDNAFVFTRDQKYFEKIKKEQFVTSTKEKIEVPLSQWGQQSELQINKILFKKSFDDDKIIQWMFDHLKENQDLMIKWIKNAKSEESMFVPFEVEATKAQDPELLMAKTIRNRQAGQMQLSLNEKAKNTLFEIYVKYVSAFENKNINFEAMDIFINYLITNQEKLGIKINKKLIYQKIGLPEASSKTFSWLDNLTIFEYLEKIKTKAVSFFAKTKSEPYVLPLGFKYAEEKINTENYDGANSYDLSFTNEGFDSKNVEANFYHIFCKRLAYLNKKIIEKDENRPSKGLHIFRNGTDEKSYYLEYLDQNDKIRSFYPDFFFINDLKKEIYIIETKGRSAMYQNIDQKSTLKFNTTNEQLEKMHKNYKIHVYWIEPSANKREYTLFARSKENITLDEFLEKVTENTLDFIYHKI